MTRRSALQGHPLGANPAYAHAPIANPTQRPDGRSVGELLRDADHLARDLLYDLTAHDAAPLIRGWADFIASAHAAWATIGLATTPDADGPRSSRRGPADPMVIMRGVAAGIGATVPRSRWPGTGRTSPALRLIADDFDRASALITRSGAQVPVHRDGVREDAEAARTRILHTVYLVAHATKTALLEQGRHLHTSGGRRGRGLPLAEVALPYAVGPTNRWIARINICERVAARHLQRVDGGFASAAAGEALPDDVDPDRILRALARWDVQAHRTLAAAPSAHHLILVARTQGLITGSLLPVLDAATATSTSSLDDDVDRLRSLVEDAGTAWNYVARCWTDLARSAVRVDPSLVEAAGQVRAACREVTHTSAVKATPEDIGSRVDLPRVLDGFERSLSSAVDLADVVREVSTNPALSGPARPLSIRAHSEVELARIAGRASDGADVVWVSPQDVLANRNVVVPPPVAARLVEASHLLVVNASRASLALDSGRSSAISRRDDHEESPGEVGLDRRSAMEIIGASASEEDGVLR